MSQDEDRDSDVYQVGNKTSIKAGGIGLHADRLKLQPNESHNSRISVIKNN
jgi:hypothetical protein